MAHINKIKNELEILKKIILEKVPTEQIWLFGSYAYGTPTKNSDIDIYIVMKDNAKMRETEAMTEVDTGRILNMMTKPVDVLASKKNNFLYRRGGRMTLEKTIAEKGIKIYG